LNKNTKINLSKLAHVHRYKLATNWKNFTKIYLVLGKILQKVLVAPFLTHTVYYCDVGQRTILTYIFILKIISGLIFPSMSQKYFLFLFHFRSVKIIFFYFRFVSASLNLHKNCTNFESIAT